MKFKTAQEYYDFLNSLPMDERIAITERKERRIFESNVTKENIVIQHHNCTFEELKAKVGGKTLTEVLSEIESDMKAKLEDRLRKV